MAAPDKKGTSYEASTGAAVIALGSIPIGWEILAASVGAGLVVAGFSVALGADKDDFLGILRALIPTVGASDETREWMFSQEGYWSGWRCTVRYRIRRDGIGVSTETPVLATLVVASLAGVQAATNQSAAVANAVAALAAANASASSDASASAAASTAPVQ